MHFMCALHVSEDENVNPVFLKECSVCKPSQFWGLPGESGLFLTHWGLVTPFGDIDLGQHWLICKMTNSYQFQCIKEVQHQLRMHPHPGSLLYPPLQCSWGGYTGFTLSVCPYVRLSVCGQNRVRSVSSTILVGFISYLHILSSNFRRCVACNACFKIQNFEIFANSLNL